MTGIDSDARIILAEGIVKRLSDMVKNRQIPLTMDRQKILSRLAEINSKLMALKWSYKPLDKVLQSKELRDIEIFIKDIFDSFPVKWEEMLTTRGLEGRQTTGLLLFMRNFFYRLRERLTNGLSNDFADTIDILVGEIQTIEKVDGSNWKCMVSDGQARYFVVTNIPELKKGDVLPIAKLPPQAIHGIYSEGMFMSAPKEELKFTKEDVGKRPELTDKELGQARGILESMFLHKK